MLLFGLGRLAGSGVYGHGVEDVDAEQGNCAEGGGSAETLEKGLKAVYAANDLIVFFHVVVVGVIAEKKFIGFVLG